MKSIKKAMFVLAIGLICGIYNADAQVIVKTKPLSPHVVRMGAPTPQHVWIGDEWAPDNGAYVFRGGRWALPPQPGERWVPGHWRAMRDGYVWVPGLWR